MANPLLRCDSGSMSPTNARKGSMLMLMLASMIHSIPAATQSTGDRGMKTMAAEASKAPTRKNGRRRPHLPQVRSDM